MMMRLSSTWRRCVPGQAVWIALPTAPMRAQMVCASRPCRRRTSFKHCSTARSIWSRRNRPLDCLVHYGVGPQKGGPEAIDRDELKADIAVARKLFDDPRSSGADGSWDAPALVAAAALEAQFVNGTDVPIEAMSFAADTVLRIAECDAGLRPFDFEETFFEDGADRSAARALPLLLLPVATKLRAVAGRGDETATFGRTACGLRQARGSCPE